MVVSNAASKAKLMGAGANDSWDDFCELGLADVAFDSVFAVRGRAPFEVVAVVDEGAVEQGAVPGS